MELKCNVERPEIAYSTPRRNAYASTLEWGGRISFGLLVVAFVVYLFGIFDAVVPVNRVSTLWKLSAEEYLRHTGTSSGWGWVLKIQYADFFNIVPIAILSSVTCLCYTTTIPFLIKERDRLLLLIVVGQILVLLLAASGVVSGH